MQKKRNKNRSENQRNNFFIKKKSLFFFFKSRSRRPLTATEKEVTKREREKGSLLGGHETNQGTSWYQIRNGKQLHTLFRKSDLPLLYNIMVYEHTCTDARTHALV